jgi:hypothetical protein
MISANAFVTDNFVKQEGIFNLNNFRRASGVQKHSDNYI